jgi:hypothetical protein
MEQRKYTRCWVGDAATSAPVECVKASVYQLLILQGSAIFLPHIYILETAYIQSALKETVLYEGFTV